MEKIQVVLMDGTVGELVALLPEGKVTVALHDENGMPIEVTGTIAAYL